MSGDESEGTLREFAPDAAWRATLAAVAALVDEQGADWAGLRISGSAADLVLWDAETGGAARVAICASDPRGSFVDKLQWLAEHEQRMWGLVREGRYLIGTLDSYLIARLTRGLWHVLSRDRARDAGLLADDGWLLADQTPEDAHPDFVDTGGRAGTTDPAVFGSLKLPITLE